MTRILIAAILLHLAGAVPPGSVDRADLQAGVGATDTVHVGPPTGEQETDRTRILAALDEVETGETVQFAAGTYVVGDFIEVPVPEIELVGHPDGTTLQGCEPGELVEPRVPCNGLQLTGDRQTVRDLTFEHASHALWVGCCLADSESGYGAEGTHVGGHLFEGNTFRSTWNGVRVIGDSPDPVVIQDNDFVDTWHAAVVNGRTAHILDNRISVPEPERVPINGHAGLAMSITPFDTGLEHPFTCAGNVIAGNRIEGHPEGIAIQVFRSGAACRENVIRDNTIVVRRARFTPPSFGVIGIRNEADSTLAGVPLALVDLSVEMASQFPELPDETGDEELVHDNLIEGNHVVGAAGVAIELFRASRNRVVENTISDVVARDPFPGNTMYFAPEWREANSSGVWISPGSDENEIAGNTFEDIEAAAVFLEGDDNRVELRSAGDAVRDLGTGTEVSVVDGAEGRDVAAEDRVAGEAGAVQPADRYEGPIIDMHLHAYTEDTYWGVGPDGAIPLGATGEPAPASAEEHRRRTLEVMEEYGVVLGAISGDELRAAEAFKERAPDRFLVGIGVSDPVADLDVEEFLGWVRNGRLDVFAEIGAQYGGYSPSDPAFEPYWSVAEAHGIPVGIHTGESFPGTPYSECCPNFRLRLGDPLLLEDMLVAHPDLKVVVMHAGGWFYERTLQLMQMYPQVYAEIGVLGHAAEHRTTRTLERFLERAKAFGYLDRVMFGSDQMVWPEAIGVSVEAVQAIDFLTVEEKAAILYDNAARFLELSEEEVAWHRTASS